MWQLVNHTPFHADRAFTRDKEGVEVWLVAVKGTYTIREGGELDLADEQAEVCVGPEYFGEQGRSSLRYESDLTPAKPGTDVLLNGHAYAPHGTPTPDVNVMMKVGRLSKVLHVIGDRVWQGSALGPKMTRPRPFLRMPLVYERAFGGIDQRADDPAKHRWEARNLMGTGFATKPEHLIGQRAPNVYYPNDDMASWKQRPRPAGFGPIARHWSPRRELAGTYDGRWQRERQPLLPLDFDARHHQCAPEDQQVPGYLRGGERVELYNLTRGGFLQCTLPKVRLAFRTFFSDGPVEHRARLHTVFIEPDVPRLMMVWHTHLPCHNKEHKLERTVITQKEYVEL